MFVANGHAKYRVFRILYQPTYGPINKPDKRATCVLPFHPATRELGAFLQRKNVKVYFKSGRTSYNILRSQPPTDIMQRTGVVYNLHCNECPAQYIGQTGRRLDTRVREHESAARKGDVFHSAIAEHLATNNHALDRDSITVLDHDSNDRRRCIKETVQIVRNHDSLLAQNYSSTPISSVWHNVINML